MTSTRGLFAFAVALMVGLQVACGSGSRPGSAGGELAAAGIPDPGVVHVHGLGINPEDGALFAATHTGLFKIQDGTAERVGDRFQDTMGFTVTGPNRFLGSGHPDVRDYTAGKLPGLLGLIESKDAGLTWESLSLLGDVDFHLLSFSHNRIYGFDSTGGRFMVSTDGKEWDTRSSVMLLSFAVSPSQPDVVLGATPEGLHLTRDTGREWESVSGPVLVLLGWPSPELLFGVDAEGAVYRSPDGGSTWTQESSLPGPAEAFLVTADRLFVAVAEDEIYASDDLGKSWNVYYGETE